MRLVGVPGVVAVWLILCPGCRKDLEQLSHRRQRVVGCVDGVAGLEGRLGKLSHATKVCLCMVMIARGWRGVGVEGQRE